MFKRRKKAQGALEYLLLIGGAVLIAVIVIALLVGMGGQSRDAAKRQADKANATLTQPTAAEITQVTAKYADCTPESTENAKDGNAPMTFSWLPGDGSNKLYMINSDGAQVNIAGYTDSNILKPMLTKTTEGVALDPTKKSSIPIYVYNIGTCGDTYSAYVVTIRNNVPVTSVDFPVTWNQ